MGGDAANLAAYVKTIENSKLNAMDITVPIVSGEKEPRLIQVL